jgi:hypothetical protein
VPRHGFAKFAVTLPFRSVTLILAEALAIVTLPFEFFTVTDPRAPLIKMLPFEFVTDTLEPDPSSLILPSWDGPAEVCIPAFIDTVSRAKWSGSWRLIQIPNSLVWPTIPDRHNGHEEAGSMVRSA